MLDHAGGSKKECADSTPAPVETQFEENETRAAFEGISKGFLEPRARGKLYDGKSPEGPQKKGAFSDALFETLISGERYLETGF